MNAFKRNASITLATLVAVFVICEALLRALASVTTIYDIEMMHYARELKQKSSLDGVFHEHRPNSSAALMGVEVSLNSLGHRSAELAIPKPADERRIHVLGSSIALGWGVAERQAFPAVLERRLNDAGKPEGGPRYTVINAGIGNYNTVLEVELFKHQSPLTQPDAVVLQYFINDAELISEGADNPILMYSTFAAFANLRLRSLISVANTSLEAHYTALYEDGNPGWERARRSIAELKALCDALQIPLVVLLVPELHDLSPDNPYGPIYGQIEDFVEALGVPFINPLEAVRGAVADGRMSPWVAPDDPHPSAAIHEVLGVALAAALGPILDQDN